MENSTKNADQQDLNGKKSPDKKVGQKRASAISQEKEFKDAGSRLIVSPREKE